MKYFINYVSKKDSIYINTIKSACLAFDRLNPNKTIYINLTHLELKDCNNLIMTRYLSKRISNKHFYIKILSFDEKLNK